MTRLSTTGGTPGSHARGGFAHPDEGGTSEVFQAVMLAFETLADGAPLLQEDRDGIELRRAGSIQASAYRLR